jgi:hypothetical protein
VNLPIRRSPALEGSVGLGSTGGRRQMQAAQV